jgi:hypothetical protein
MKEYHKIQTVFKRDPETKYKTLLEDDYSKPEFEYLQHNKWIFTEKVDGTNIRVMFNGNQIIFGGKTDRAQIPGKLLNRLRERFDHQLDFFKAIFDDGNEDILEHLEVCFYGEGYGAKIQKGGGNYCIDQDFVLFDVNVNGWWLQRNDIEDIAVKFGIDVVPIIGEGTLPEMVEKVRGGFHSQWGDFMAEGIVARPETELRARNGERIITKLKVKDFIRR